MNLNAPCSFNNGSQYISFPVLVTVTRCIFICDIRELFLCLTPLLIKTMAKVFMRIRFENCVNSYMHLTSRLLGFYVFEQFNVCFCDVKMISIPKGKLKLLLILKSFD